MGSVFGKESVEEPPFTVLMTRHQPAASIVGYEIRKYGERFAAETNYVKSNKNDGDGGGGGGGGGGGDDTRSPFMSLARYIGVFGNPENEGDEAIAMTAPVVIQPEQQQQQQQQQQSKGGTAIAMTAPVSISEQDGVKKMQFMLPSKYNEISEIPKPTNPAIHILEIPSEVGAVLRFNGNFNDKRCQEMATKLVDQLQADGVNEPTTEVMMEQYQMWGYNPPFTLPYFKRNEVWIPLSQKEADNLVSKYGNGEALN